MTKIIGLTGSFGSGKSTVAGMIRDLGVPVQDADAVAHEVITRGTEGLQEIVGKFGEEVLNENGELDRKKMAATVFNDPDARKKLNSIIHPRVRERQAEFLKENSDEPAVVLDIPLLLESGARDMFHSIIVVTCNERNRFGRLRGRGFGEREIIARLGAQMAQSRKIELADHVIDNNGDLESTRHAVSRVMSNFIGADKTQSTTERQQKPAGCGA